MLDVRKLAALRAVATEGSIAADEFPRVTGVTQRIRLLSERFARGTSQGQPTWEPLPGTLSWVEVSRCPRWFTRRAPRDQDTLLRQTGVLLDLTVVRRDTRPDLVGIARRRYRSGRRRRAPPQ